MKRFLVLSVLAFLLSACIYLVSEDGGVTVGPPQTVQAPSSGNYTYTCSGGRLVVNYVDSNTVRVFYNDAFQTLNLSRTAPERVYSNGVYTWQLNRNGVGAFFVQAQQERSGCSF